MLEEIREVTANIHEVKMIHASELYLRAMDFVLQLRDQLNRESDKERFEEIRLRLYEAAEATQILAYEFYHQHHQPIADGAIDPESFDYAYMPPNQGAPYLDRIELQPYLIEYLRTNLPYTLPIEMR